ncbi:MAG: phosphotransferase [Desulfobacteraceae bacterium]|nr:phosphotransferase [Desulfobacteraceae bacterium]
MSNVNCHITNEGMPPDFPHAVYEFLTDVYGIENVWLLEKIDRGYVNQSYEVGGQRQGKKVHHCLRCYHPLSDRNNIRFEHDLLKELARRRFPFSPRLVRASGGTTISTIRFPMAGHVHTRCAALFEFIDGEDPYTWDNPPVDERVIAGCARVLALYHGTISGWESHVHQGSGGLLSLLHRLQDCLGSHADQAGEGESVFDAFVHRHMGTIADALDGLVDRFSGVDIDSWPVLAVHGDFHAGNLRFRAGEVAGLLDYDWARMLPRTFDLGMALMYFCTRWGDHRSAALDTSRATRFLEAYQRSIEYADGIWPLGRDEHKFITDFIRIGHLMMIAWGIEDYFTSRPDPEAYTAIVRRSFRAMAWLDAHPFRWTG